MSTLLAPMLVLWVINIHDLLVAAETPTEAPAIPPKLLRPSKPNNPYYKNQYYNNLYNNQYYNPNYAGSAVPILSYSNEHVGDGTYAFSFATGDGKQAQESGFLKDAYVDNTGNPQGTQVVQGSFAYVSPEGTPIQISYVADENGFRPSGVHIPANGNGILPLSIGDRNERPFDSHYSRYDPYTYRRAQYKRPEYDPRYPYDPAKYTYDSRYNAYATTQNKEAKKETT